VQYLVHAEMAPPFEEAGGVLQGPNSLGKGIYELLQVAVSPTESRQLQASLVGRGALSSGECDLWPRPTSWSWDEADKREGKGGR